MALSGGQNSRRNNQNRRSKTLTPEQLEPRLLLSVTNNSSQSLTASQLGAAAWSSANSTPKIVSSSPSVRTVSSAGSFEVTGVSAPLSVQGVSSTSGSTPTLKYVWTTTAAPSGGKVTFARNGTVTAKDNSLQFSKTGAYAVKVTVLSGTSLVSTTNLQLNVIPTPSRLLLKDANGRTVSAGATVRATGSDSTLRTTTLDQFGQSFASQPNVTWETVKSPVGGTATFSSNGNNTSVNVNHAGIYLLRARSGSASSTFILNAAQTLTSLELSTSSGQVDPEDLLVTTTTTQQLKVEAFDQFSNLMTAPTITWSTLATPVGGKATVKVSNGIATTTLTRAGDYEIRGVASGITVSYQVTAEATVSRLTLRTPLNKEIASNGSVAVSGADYRFTPVAMDQFGQPIGTTPDVTWTVTKAPTNGTVTFTEDGSEVVASVNSVGTYTLQASCENKSTTVSLKVSQTLASLSLSTPAGPVDPLEPLMTNSASQQLLMEAFDQFSNAMTVPSIKWTTVSAPTGGKPAVKVSRGVVTATVSRAGTYGLQGVASGIAVSFQMTAEPSVTRLSVRSPQNKEIPSNGSVTVSGTGYQLTTVAIDQFGQTIESPPDVTWTVIKAPTNGEATLTEDGNDLSVVVDTLGTYTLQATCDSKFSIVTLKVSQALSKLNLKTPSGPVDPEVPLETTTTSQQFLVETLDQFDNVMTAPTMTWTTLSAPTGGKAAVKVTKGVAVAAFTKAGTYELRGVAAGVAVTFQVTAEATPARLSVRTPLNKEVSLNGSVAVTGTSYQLSTIAMDQFGQPLASQPEFSWEVVRGPADGTLTTTETEGGVEFAADKSGIYSLKVTSGTAVSTLSLNFMQVLSSFSLVVPDGDAVSPSSPISVEGSTFGLELRALDQFENPMISTPSISWTTIAAPTGGGATVKVASGLATVSFRKVGNYSIRATTGSFIVTAEFIVVPSLSSIVAYGIDGRQLGTSATVVMSASSVVTLRGIDQYQQLLADTPEFTWSTISAPSSGDALVTETGTDFTATFSKAGLYVLRASSGDIGLNLTFNVAQVHSSVVVTPGSLTVAYGTTQQFFAQSLDQFEEPTAGQPTIVWSATGGSITSRGLFTAGSQTGDFTVSAKMGSVTRTISISVIPPTVPDGLVDPDLADLVDSYYDDGQINRVEMIDILRSAGNDGVVSATELADFQFLVSSITPFTIPDYVRGLATDVVNASPANLKYKGQTAGNLVGGSSATLLNNLVDKWFLGTDEPTLTSSSLSYQTTAGTLFNGTPSRSDARQGMLGDCYFIASVAAIADSNPQAVQNMFVDNGDDTYTVRFYVGSTGQADYVTISRRLPVQSNGALAYSGYGLSASSSSTTIWIALAEKAYAQWNETGNEGRDGTNRYSAIEGGWMGEVNKQVLGVSSSNYSINTSTKPTLISALANQKAVTIGTYQSVSAGLVGSHAYLVTGYNSSTDTFQLHNPWGTSHPGALSFSQLQAYCSMFVVTDPTGSSGFGSSVFSTSEQSLPAIPATDTNSTGLTSRLGSDANSDDLMTEEQAEIVASILGEVAQSHSRSSSSMRLRTAASWNSETFFHDDDSEFAFSETVAELDSSLLDSVMTELAEVAAVG